MYTSTWMLAVLATVLQVAAVPGAPRVPHFRGARQQPIARQPTARRDLPTTNLTYVYNKTRADAVMQTFQISWDGYYEYAFPHDSLQPVSKTSADDRNGWGASAIDALSTALVMGKQEVVDQIVDYIPSINFANTSTEVSLFETTIRYLGGLVSAYDLLTGPLSNLASDDAKVKAILTQATNLADNLKFAFDTPTGIPDNIVFLSPPRRNNSITNGVATVGTLIMEWQRLSDQTGNPEYGLLAQKGEEYLLRPKPASAEPFPGLIGSELGIGNGSFVDSSGAWTGGTDSFYEYLIKMYLYDPVKFEFYKDRWVLAVDSSIEYLASSPTTRPDLTFLAIYNNASSIIGYSQHLACFDGGNFILGGLELNRPDLTEFGLKLVAGCRETYIQTATGIGPEVFRWVDAEKSANKTIPADQADFYDRAGFWITTPDYVLRPEVMESYYYAYRATGDVKYQEWAWEAFLAINSTCAAGVGYSSVNDVNVAGGGGFQDFQESFWFAEVLKYSYLIHAEDADYQFKADGTNEWVFNTEAHPVKIPSKA